MNKTIKDATIKMFQYERVDQFKVNLQDFLNYYNCAKKLRALKRRSPYDFVLQKWKECPKLLHKDPRHYCVGGG